MDQGEHTHVSKMSEQHREERRMQVRFLSFILSHFNHSPSSLVVSFVDIASTNSAGCA